jgi:hypothetical protein
MKGMKEGRPKRGGTMTAIKGKRIYLCAPYAEGESTKAVRRARRALIRDGALSVMAPCEYIAEGASRERGMLLRLQTLTSTVTCSARDTGQPLYDLMALLDGWESDPRCRLEREVAEAIGIPAIGLEEAIGAKLTR